MHDFPAQQRDWFQARSTLLASVAATVEALWVHRCGNLEPSQLLRLLRCLAPAAAREVHLLSAYVRSLPDEAVPALAALTGLTRLELGSSSLPDGTAALLRGLSGSLRSLSLETDDVSTALAAALPALQQLTSLQLSSDGPLPRFDWRRLTALTRLRRLELDQTYSHEESQFEPPSPADFGGRLTDLTFFADAWSLKARALLRRGLLLGTEQPANRTASSAPCCERHAGAARCGAPASASAPRCSAGQRPATAPHPSALACLPLPCSSWRAPPRLVGCSTKRCAGGQRRARDGTKTTMRRRGRGQGRTSLCTLCEPPSAGCHRSHASPAVAPCSAALPSSPGHAGRRRLPPTPTALTRAGRLALPNHLPCPAGPWTMCIGWPACRTCLTPC